MKPSVKLLSLVVLSLTVAGCEQFLDGVDATIKSSPTEMAPGFCSQVTVHNHISTNRKRKPSKERLRLDIYRYTLGYKVYATEEAEAPYQGFVLGSFEHVYEDSRITNGDCEVWYDEEKTECKRYQQVRVHDPILRYGASTAYQIEYTNVLDKTKRIPSHFNFSLKEIWTKGEGVEFDNRSYLEPQLLDCYYTHVITLYNSSQLPGGDRITTTGRMSTSSTTLTTSGVNETTAYVSSFPLLTKTELHRLKNAGGNENEVREMRETYARRALDFKKYLADATRGKSEAALIATAIQNGNWKEAASMARKSATSSADFTASEVLAIFPGATDVIGQELSAGFAKSVAETLNLQAKIAL